MVASQRQSHRQAYPQMATRGLLRPVERPRVVGCPGRFIPRPRSLLAAPVLQWLPADGSENRRLTRHGLAGSRRERISLPKIDRIAVPEKPDRDPWVIHPR
jgi:hypothetical protein